MGDALAVAALVVASEDALAVAALVVASEDALAVAGEDALVADRDVDVAKTVEKSNSS